MGISGMGSFTSVEGGGGGEVYLNVKKAGQKSSNRHRWVIVDGIIPSERHHLGTIFLCSLLVLAIPCRHRADQSEQGKTTSPTKHTVVIECINQHDRILGYRTPLAVPLSAVIFWEEGKNKKKQGGTP